MNIAIYCGSSFGNDKIYEEKAKEIIRFLSKHNTKLVYGGSNSGIMGTISSEAILLGMDVIGVISKNLSSLEVLNKNVKNIIEVDNIRERKAMMESLADAFIALPGGFGTLEEISEVFTAIQIGEHTKPCALYNLNGYYDKLVDFLKSCVEKGFLQQVHLDAIIISDDISYIYDQLENYSPPKSKWSLI